MKQKRETTPGSSCGNLLSTLDVGCVIPLEPQLSKSRGFFRLASELARAGAIPLDSVEQIVSGLILRECCGSSAWGNGLAFPQLRTRWVSRPIAAIGTAPHGLNFGARDGLPTRLVILLLSPYDHREQHAAILGQLAALLHDRTLPFWLQAVRSSGEVLAHLGIGSRGPAGTDLPRTESFECSY